MRYGRMVLIFLTLAGSAVAGGEGKKPPVGTIPAAEAQAFAIPLGETIDWLAREYLSFDKRGQPHTVTRGQLARAALQALYEAADTPAPPSLAADVGEAPYLRSLVRLVARVRAELGRRGGLRDSDAVRLAVDGITRTLDGYSVVASGEELYRVGTLEPRGGLGLELAECAPAAPLVVRAVVPGGPAQRAGVRPGDRILRVNGQAAEAANPLQMRHWFDGSASASDATAPGAVDLSLSRAGRALPGAVHLEPVLFRPELAWGLRRKPDNTWDFWADRRLRIAVIRVGRLDAGTAASVFQTVQALREEGLEGLVLDLRASPGGLLSEATDLARLFLGNAPVGTVRGRDEKAFTSEDAPEKCTSLPLVVLVNGETSGAAELAAAALQDNGRARVAGQRTRGKASIQTVLALPLQGAVLKVTNGTLVRPSGRNLQRFADSTPDDDWGVRPDPDLDVRVSPELSRRLADWWTDQTLRPPTETGASPLDEADADPQLRVACRSVRAAGK